MKKRHNRIVFLNQMAGPLFRELVEDLARAWPPCLLYTGHRDTIKHGGSSWLHIEAAPGYDRRGNISRLISWLSYFFLSIKIVWSQPRNSLLFIVSNPPFLGLAGAFFKGLRKQPYAILVYDIYPDILLRLRRLKSHSLARCWHLVNRLVYRHANMVFTIGHDMAYRLEQKLHTSKADTKEIICIPLWADVETLRPIAKDENWFALQYGLQLKTTVLYSGNMGHSHDIETILEAAMHLAVEKGIFFVFIGEGAKWSLVERTIKDSRLENVLLLPFQPESILPYTMASADIGIATYQPGTEGCMIPSKTFSYMAAGVVPVIVSSTDTDLTKMVEEKGCGLWVKSGDGKALARIITDLHADNKKLMQLKNAARNIAKSDYSRNNTKQFEQALRKYLP